MKRTVIRVAAAAALVVVVFALAFVGASLALRVPENCESINRVIDYVDSLAQRTTASASGPEPQVADPEVQKLIHDGRQENTEFREFAAAQSRKARCDG